MIIQFLAKHMSSPFRGELNDRRKGIVLFSALIAINLYWTWQNFPAIMSLDSVHTWGEINGFRPLNDHHTSAWNIYCYLLSVGGRFVFTLTIFQQFIILFALYIFLKVLNPIDSVKNKLIYLILLSFTPYVNMFPLTWWKDIPYSALTLFGISLLILAHQSKNGGMKYYVSACVILSLSFTFRHNGVYVGLLVLTILFLLLLFTKSLKNKNSRLILIVITLSIVLGSLIHGSLPKLIGAKELPNSTPYQGFLHEIMVVISTPNAIIPSSVSNFTESLSDLGLTPEYLECNPYIFADTVMPTLLISDLNYNYLNENYKSIIPTWYTLLKLNPEIIVNNRLCRFNNFIPPPFSHVPKNIYWFHEGIEINDYGLVYNPSYNSYRIPFIIVKEFWRWNENFVAWPGLQLLFILIFSFINLKLARDFFKYLLILTVSISSVLILITASPGPDARYLYLNSLIFSAMIVSNLGGYTKKIWRRIRDLNP
jgi:hypothetical protein